MRSQLPSRRPCPPSYTPLQARHRRSARDPALSKIDGPPPPEAPLLPAGKLRQPSHSLSDPSRVTVSSLNSSSTASNIPAHLGSRNRPRPRPRRQRQPALAVTSHPSAARKRGSVPRPPLRRRELVRHPREAGHDYAKGHPASEANTWGVGRLGLRRGCRRSETRSGRYTNGLKERTTNARKTAPHCCLRRCMISVRMWEAICKGWRTQVYEVAFCCSRRWIGNGPRACWTECGSELQIWRRSCLGASPILVTMF